MAQKVSASLEVTPEIQGRILGYLGKDGDDTSFTDSIWKGCEPHVYELRRYPLHARTLLMFMRGKSLSEIAKATVLDRYGIVLSFEAVQRWARKA